MTLEGRLRDMTVTELQTWLKIPHLGEYTKEAIRKVLAEKRGEKEPQELDLTLEDAPPIFLTVPWDMLVSDNLRHGAPTTRKERENRKRYKAAIADMAAYLGAQLEETPRPPCAVTYTMYLPDLRDLDPPNYFKALNDAMKQTVLPEDNWKVVPDWRIRVGGLDAANPRLEVEIRCLR